MFVFCVCLCVCMCVFALMGVVGVCLMGLDLNAGVGVDVGSVAFGVGRLIPWLVGFGLVTLTARK